MLSFALDDKLLSYTTELNYKLSRSVQLLQGYTAEKRTAIHQFARVSQIGASTRIENAVLTDSEIEWMDTVLTQDAKPTAFQDKKLLIENKLSKDRERSIEEVVGCRSMLNLVYQQYADFSPLTEADLRGLHHELLRHYPSAAYYLGQYKTVSNSVVARNNRTGEERVVFKTAAPGVATAVAMSDLVRWYNETSQQRTIAIAVASELTFRFLAIHPFQDGNGRVGRALFLLALLQSHDEVVASVARYLAIDRQIEKHKEEYYLVLQRCSNGVFKEDPKEFNIQYFCRYMVKIFNAALDDIEFYANRYDSIRRLPESAVKVFQCFKEFPEKKLQLKELIQQTKLPRRTVNYAVGVLLKQALLQKYGQARGTRYQVMF